MTASGASAGHAAALGHFNRGNELRQQGRHEEALGAFQAAVAADPAFAEAHVNAGFLLERAELLPGAVAAYARAAALNPNLHEAFHNLGSVQMKLGHFDEAVAAIRRAVALRPDHMPTLLGLANLHRLRNEVTDAEIICRRVVAQSPGFASGWINLANILRAQNRVPEALSACARALALAPDSPPAHLNLAMALLVSGELRAGWPHAEYRHQLKVAGAGREFAQPTWQGADPLVGRTILLHAEQGLGDSIQFLRYVPLVQELGAQVVLEVQRPLKALATASFPAVEVLGHGEPLPAFDLQCALPSLPRAFATELATIPSTMPYLNALDAHRHQWRDGLAEYAGRRVGLAWAGNPGHPNDVNRSIPLSLLAPLIRSHPEIHFFNLKTEVLPTDEPAFRELPELIDIGRKFRDFAESAAAVEQLDLVIAVDTSVAHLAGAMGRPLWVLLPFSPDWRWLLEREDSPWYPTARLFRQPAIGDWATVVGRLGRALQEWR